MGNIAVRNMTNEDWPDVAKIYEEGIKTGIATFQETCPSFEEWDQDHLSECRLLAMVGDCAAGWIALSPTSKKRAYRGAVEVSVYVSERFRQQGVGEILLNNLKEEAEKMGYWSLCSYIIAENTGSIRLHTKCGFRMVGRREKVAKDCHGTWQDTVIMEYRSNTIY